MNMGPNHLNSSEGEAAKQRADELARQAQRGSWLSGIFTTIFIAAVIIGILFWIAYGRTS
ncbi:hypothetical protein [Paenibacillus xylanexedens]|uniref:hypothetical protein n=1 Tax=Paenibacillus xylanexedens TaxID=528191 RepID=UPI0011A53A4F|nr:hypothetical protein [Paenibacillus xylanexedens]